MIYFLSPEVTVRSAGIRILYRQVQILKRAGIDAAILYQTRDFCMPDIPADVPVVYDRMPDLFRSGDILVIPEIASPQFLALIKPWPVRHIMIALNWQIYACITGQTDWRDYHVERVITHSPHIADFVQWAMGLPVQTFTWAVNANLYYPTPGAKVPQIVYIKRKEAEMPLLLHLLRSRNPQYVEAIRWVVLDNMSEVEYAAEIRRAQLFLNLSHAEGLPCSLLEAMRAGTLVAGWNSVGGKRELIGSGNSQNGIFVENLDYPELAKVLEPVLCGIIRGNLAAWEPIRANALAFSQLYNEDAEIQSVLALWKNILGK
jgi:hypothetical protein